MRWFWLLVSGLVGAASGGFAAHGVLFFGSPRVDALLSEHARAVLRADARLDRELLAFSCGRDVEVERLALELAAGATETGAPRLAERLTRTLAGEVSVLVEERGALRRLSPGADPEVQLLRRAQRVRVVTEARLDATLFDACSRRQGARTLWILHSDRPAEVLRQAGLDPSRYHALREPARAEAQVDALHSETLDGAELSVLATPDSGARPAQLPVVLFLCSLAGGLLGATLAFLATRPRSVDESVLATLEQAAARVAQGDLSSQIGVRFGGRADQTVRSFDRMTAELRETRAKLADAERAAAWQDMAQRIAHEIKNPLSPIRVALETLRKAHAKRLPAFDEIFAESTHAMLEEVQRMERIVREFSEFARLPKARPGAMALGALAQETAGLYTPDDVQLELRVPEREQLIHADREQLTQVLVNLIANAVHAARANERPQLRVSLAQSAQETTLQVEDNGPGVAPEHRERIFEPYVTDKAEGTGLGLAIARRIVSDHGGTLSVHDSELGGACFTLRLPRDPAPAA